jgi:hypothetical protein
MRADAAKSSINCFVVLPGLAALIMAANPKIGQPAFTDQETMESRR